MATTCETYLGNVSSYTSNTVVKLTDTNTNLVNVENRIKELKDLVTLSNTKTQSTNDKLDNLITLMTSLVIAIKGEI